MYRSILFGGHPLHRGIFWGCNKMIGGCSMNMKMPLVEHLENNSNLQPDSSPPQNEPLGWNLDLKFWMVYLKEKIDFTVIKYLWTR